MPLIHSSSKQALKKNIGTEMKAHPDKRSQDLAIAYAIKRRGKKMSEGGMVENEDLHPLHNNPTAVETADIDHLHQSAMKQNHDQPMDTPAEPKEHVEPKEEDMGRNMDMHGRVAKALHMAFGGLVGSDADRTLAMKDTYPPGAAESDTQAQDEGFGNGPMDNEEGDEDQMEARRKTRASRALDAARMKA